MEGVPYKVKTVIAHVLFSTAWKILLQQKGRPFGRPKDSPRKIINVRRALRPHSTHVLTTLCSRDPSCWSDVPQGSRIRPHANSPQMEAPGAVPPNPSSPPACSADEGFHTNHRARPNPADPFVTTVCIAGAFVTTGPHPCPQPPCSLYRSALPERGSQLLSLPRSEFRHATW